MHNFKPYHEHLQRFTILELKLNLVNDYIKFIFLFGEQTLKFKRQSGNVGLTVLSRPSPKDKIVRWGLVMLFLTLRCES